MKFRKIIRKLFIYDGINAQLFGTNEKSIYRYKTNKMCEICKFDTQYKKNNYKCNSNQTFSVEIAQTTQIITKSYKDITFSH